MSIELYDHPLSPYAQKVKIALREKEIAFTAPMPADLGSGRTADTFAKANPRAEVPTLLHDGAAIWDSTVILEYIEERFPTPALRATDALTQAKVRMIEDAMDTHFEAITWGLSEVINFGRAEGEAAQRLQARGGEEIRSWHQWLDARLAGQAWFTGARFGWGDLAVIPFLNGAAGFGHAPPPATALADWFARANARPSVAATRKEAEAVAMNASGNTLQMVRAAIESGAFKREYRDHRLEWMIRNGAIDIVARGLERHNIRFTEAFQPE